MSDSVQTLFEEARRCPSCGEPGVRLNVRPAPRGIFPPGTKVETYECRNDTRCPDYVASQTAGPDFSKMAAIRNRWAVQVNPDGTIPPKDVGRTQEKAFDTPADDTMFAQRARDHLAFLAAQDEGDGNRTHEIGRDLGYL